MKQNQLDNKRNILEIVKSTVVSIFIFFIVFVVCSLIIYKIDIDYETYSENISDIYEKISSFFSVMIGVYVAVLVFLATSRTPISGLLHRQRSVKRFSKVVRRSTAYAFLFVLIEIFIPFNCNISVAVMCAIAFIGLGYMIYFIVIVFMMFDYNIVKLEEESIIQNNKSENFITLVEKIERNTRN